MTNPLLPPFSAIRPEDIVPAVQSALADCRAAVERVVAQGGPYTWDNLCQPLAEVDDRAGAHLLAGQPPELGEKQPGAARSLRANAAAAV